MKKILLSLVFACFTFNAFAGDITTLKKKLSFARETLLTLVKDTSKRGADQQKLVKNSADDVSKYLSEITPPKGKEKQWDDYKKTWSDFKHTRESELVPAILAGKQSDADKLTNGVQKERLDKMNRILDDLNGKDL